MGLLIHWFVWHSHQKRIAEVDTRDISLDTQIYADEFECHTLNICIYVGKNTYLPKMLRDQL